MLPVLSTARLRLEPVQRRDLDALVTLWNEPGVNRHLFDGVSVSPERARKLLDSFDAQARDGLGAWMVRTPDTSALVGNAALLPVGEAAHVESRLAGHVEPLIALTESRWGAGFGTEILRTLVEYAFEHLGREQIVAAVDAPNARSLQLVRRAGFVLLSEVQGRAGLLQTFVLLKARRA